MASSFVLLLAFLVLCGAEVREFVETEKSGDGNAPDTGNTREVEYPVKETIYGPIRGHLVEEKGIVAEVYTRVPYAKAPVGMLRFKVNSLYCHIVELLYPRLNVKHARMLILFLFRYGLYLRRSIKS